MQSDVHIAVAAFGRVVAVDEQGVVQGGIGWTVVYQPVAVGEHIATADGVEKVGVGGVLYVQTYHHGAVAAANGSVTVQNHCIVQYRIRRAVVEQTAVVEGGIAADGVAALGTECVVDMQMDIDITVAAVVGGMAVFHHCVVQGRISGAVAKQSSVIVHLSATDFIETVGTESVGDVQTDHHVAVAATHRAMTVNQRSVGKQRIGRSVSDKAVAIDKGIAAADALGAEGAESVVDMQSDVHIAVATLGRVVAVDEQGVVQESICSTVVYQPVAVGEHIATADGVAQVGVGGVLYVKTYHHSAVAAAHRVVAIDESGVVHPRIVRSVNDIVVSIHKSSIAADGVVA